jgi:hypothetical protein
MLFIEKRQLLAIGVILCVLLPAGSAANAQNATGVSDKEIVIGSCAALDLQLSRAGNHCGRRGVLSICE